jgi:negative regulator of sigma E activity
MNDDELPARAEMASAYLDGELDAAERVSVAADPETMAMVEAFAQVRGALGNVEVVDDDVKASAISAALAQFDAVQAAARIPAHAGTVTSLRTRRTRSYRLLTGLAAAAVILVVAIAALNAPRGSDSKSSASATQPPAGVDAQTGSPVLKAAPGSAAAASAPEAIATEAAPLVPAVNNANDLARYAATFARDTAAPAATSAPAGVYGGAAPAASTRGPAPATPPATCLSPADTVLGPISVLGTPAFAVRDTATGVVRAIAASNCQVLLTSP